MGAVDRPERRRVSPDGDRGPSAAKQTGLIVTATDRLNAVQRHRRTGMGGPPSHPSGDDAGEIRDGPVRRISRVYGRRPGALLVATDDGYKPATSISGRANDGRWQNLAGSEPALSGQRTVHRPRTTGQRSLHGRRRMAGHRNLHRWWAVLDLAWLARPAGRLYNVGTRGPRFQRHGRRRSDGS